ncbi:MAG: heavy metal translocating P-type ATPase [Burkholderiaceae bacterium]|nr:heavy metal translocating P-type ATPase [Burkholderiaceae bacterium]
MDFTVRHAIPGRIRLHVPVLCAPSPLAESALAWLRKQEFIVAVRINYDCANLIIEYRAEQSERLDELLDMLAGFSIDDLDQLLRFLDPTGAAGAVGAARSAHVPEKQRWPLALPTLSLALAFSRNPWSLAINVPLMLYNSYPIFKRAWQVWSREGRLNVDFLDALAISASIGQGNMVTGGVITWLIRLGDWIRDLTAAGSKRAVTELLEFRAKMAWIVRDGDIVAIPAADLGVGDTIVVYPGEMIPVDGEIVHGHGMIDQKTITGEGLPVARAVGEPVFAATILREGQLTLRALRVGSETTAGQIARLVDSAPVGDTRMQNHAERFADRLVLPTLGLAVGTAVLTRDFNRFLSLVIVDYGTGIRVAAPTAVLSSMTHAARAGIIIKSGGHMEKLAHVDTVVFDKTGTLSHGTPHVVDILSFHPHISSEHLLALAVAAETHLQHPVAEALREKIRELDIELPHCDETEYRIGLGVEGKVNGYYMHVGSERFLRQNDIRVDHIASERAEIDQRGCSCLYVAIDGQLAGLVAYEDRIRPESRQIIRLLHQMGIRDTIMLTGDNAVVAAAVGKRLGLTRQVANMMPSDKADIVQQLQREGRTVAMIGDGINDSPALSFADVGIAMKHGADITHESADVVLMEDSLWKLIKAIEISRDAVGLIKQNYGIVAVMNTVALGLALPGGLVSPEVTAVISNGSAIVASLNGLRPALRRQ